MFLLELLLVTWSFWHAGWGAILLQLLDIRAFEAVILGVGCSTRPYTRGRRLGTLNGDGILLLGALRAGLGCSGSHF